jgi:hypothetical protein
LPEVFAGFGVLMICEPAASRVSGVAIAPSSGPASDRPISPLSTDGLAPSPDSPANALAPTAPAASSAGTSVGGGGSGQATIEEDATRRTQRILVGSFVCVHSFFSDEDFVGIVTAISPEEVLVKLGTGTRLRIYVDQIRERR